jgi:MFS family permease
LLEKGESIVRASFKRIGETLRDIRRYSELFKYLLAFLIYNDGIGTIIGVAVIYGAELGFGTIELVLALLLVQFVGIPYSLIFGRLPSPGEKRRPFFLAFVLFNLVALPLAGIASARLLPLEVSGGKPPAYPSTAAASGEGVYPAGSPSIQYTGNWQEITVPASELRSEEDMLMMTSSEPAARLDFPYNGQQVEVFYSLGPDHGIWLVLLDGQPLIDPESGEESAIDAYNPTARYEVSQTFAAEAAGEHTLSLVNSGQKNPASQGNIISIAQVEVLPGVRQSNLGLIIGLIVAVEVVGLALAFLLGPLLFRGLAGRLDTKRSILLALLVYVVVAIWGFFVDSVVEFWFLAWMVAVVQGGSQALSRSLYAAMSPASKSGEFFGLFGIMEKFSAIIGPIAFAAAATLFGSSRPAVLSVIAFFIVGGTLLTLVNVEQGKRVAQMEDAETLASVPPG